ncbi:MAG: trigger factor [Candidatus Paceibacterota bacterium]
MPYNLKITEDKDGQLEISGEVSAEDFATYRPAVIKKLQATATIDGFRPGQVPEKILIDRLGEETILQQMAEEALQKAYPEIVAEKELAPIGRPAVTITKLAKDNPLGFTIKTAIVPTFDLPDYRQLATEALAETPINDEEITAKEIDDFIANLQKMEVAKNTPQKEEGGETKTEDRPPIDEAFIKKFGDFATVADFRDKIKAQLTAEKTHKQKEKRRAAILDRLAAAVNPALPDILINQELQKMLAELKGQIEQMGIKFDDYLNHLKKTTDELTAGWKDDATKRVKVGLILEKIIAAEKLEVGQDEVDQYTEAILKHHQANENIDPAAVRRYAQGVLLNEKALELLEKDA